MPAPRHRPPAIVELRITLAEITPPIWRQLLVPASFTLDALHGVIMESFGWLDCHLYEFSSGGVRYASPPDEEPSGPLATKVTIAKLALQPGDRLEYLYDFGDDWKHEIEVLGFHRRAQDLPYPHCLDGARAGPPEDCGGVPGYEELLRVLSDPEDEEHASMREWVGAHYHPETFDIRAVNRILMLRFAAR